MESQPSHRRTPPQGGAAEEKPAAGEPPRPAPVRGRGGCRGTTQGEDDVFVWRVEDGARRNYDRLGAELAARGAPLYRNQTDGHGLLLAPPGGKARLITRATQLAPVLVDLLPLEVRKEGKAVGEFPAAAALNAMLCSEQFLRHFLAVDRVAPTPVYGKDFSLLRPGYNDGGPGARVLYLGPEPRVEASTETVNRFLDVMHFAGNADRTNAVAAALTVLLRDHWPGSKPAVVITATRSHAGKGTVAEFIRGAVGKADILYEGVDWPMQHQFQKQLRADPDLGLVYLDNVRLDSAGGRPRFIRSAFVEGFVTTPAHTLASPGAGEPLSLQNRYVVVLNTNEGTLSADIMNRALPIHLDPRGDIQERRSPIGNPRLEFLPQHQGRIEAELRGMIERWREAGCPRDEADRHPMTPWAGAVGGILEVSGFGDFLANYATSKDVNDPVREALAILAAAAEPGAELRPAEWARLAVEQGLARTLFPTGEAGTEAGRARAIGVLFTRHRGDTFEARTETRRLRVRLEGGCRRWASGANPHVRYVFVPLGEEALPFEDDAR